MRGYPCRGWEQRCMHFLCLIRGLHAFFFWGGGGGAVPCKGAAVRTHLPAPLRICFPTAVQPSPHHNVFHTDTVSFLYVILLNH